LACHKGSASEGLTARRDGWSKVDTLEPGPERGMKVTMMLADAAQVAEGKLNVLGGGWSVTGPQPCPFAIAVLFEVPWQMTNSQHQLKFELIDIDGQPVLVEGENGERVPVLIEGGFEVGRPPGLRAGTTQTLPLALNSGPLPIPPGGHYEWRLEIDGETREDWRLAFMTRPENQSFAA
jgi:hypothetical protein